MIRTTLHRIGAEYLAAKKAPLKDHPLADFLRHAAAEEVANALAIPEMKVEGSPGQGNWASVPWISIFDPAVTTSATRGYYVVYLFAADLTTVSLSLNQGTTAVRKEFGAGALDELKRRAALMRSRIPEFEKSFTGAAIKLKDSTRLPRGYEAGHAFGVTYKMGDLPYEELLERDLRAISALYVRLTKRGGLDTLAETAASETEDAVREIEEIRRYSLHRKIDRNPAAAVEAKKVHGYVCQACGFDFEAVYGVVGRNYIEAHHLTPLSELPEDRPVTLNPEKDFAVLCANCHRMVHRKDAPKNILELKDLGKLNSLRGYFASLNILPNQK